MSKDKQVQVFISKDEVYPDYRYTREKKPRDTNFEGPFLLSEKDLAFVDRATKAYDKAQRILAAPVEAVEDAYRKAQQAKQDRKIRALEGKRIPNEMVL